MPKHRPSKNRKRALAVFGQLYRRHDCDLCVCFYCNAPREALDHVPPLNSLVEFGSKEFRRQRIPLVLLPSCGVCNGALGHRPLYTVLERVEFLESWYRRKVKAMPIWHKSELAELGYGLQKMCTQSSIKRAHMIDKLHNVERRLLLQENMPIFTDNQEDTSGLSYAT